MVWAWLACFLFNHRKDFTTDTVRDAIVRSCVPKHMQDLVAAVWLEQPSSATLSRRQLALDLSFALTFGYSMATLDGAIFIWADASVQRKTVWLLSTMDYVTASNLRRCYDAAIALSQSTDAFMMACDSDVDDKDKVLLRIAHDRLQHASVVKATLLRHSLMPVSVTNNTSFENKARAITQTLWFDFGARKERLQTATSMITRCVCIGWGTEFGLADAHGGDAQSYAAPWMQQTRSLLVEGSLPPSRQEYLMPNALASAGVCHCFDNIEKDLDRQLSFWPRWIIGFKLLCGLFTKVHLLEFFRSGLP